MLKIIHWFSIRDSFYLFPSSREGNCDSVQGDNLVISALKKAESNGSTVLRLHEIQGANAETPVTFLGKQQTLSEADLLEHDLSGEDERALRVNPYEIRTLELRPEK